jgi:hypothetical protein
MNKKVFTKDYLKNELELPYSAIYDEICDNSRWSIYHICVFENDGKFYQAGYSVGATECQDESPWEYEDNVECTEVELKNVMVEKWVPVE